MYVCKTCKFRRQAFQDIVVPIRRAPRLLVGRDDLQTLRPSLNDVSSPAWRNKFPDFHIKSDKIPLTVRNQQMNDLSATINFVIFCSRMPLTSFISALTYSETRHVMRIQFVNSEI